MKKAFCKIRRFQTEEYFRALLNVFTRKDFPLPYKYQIEEVKLNVEPESYTPMPPDITQGPFVFNARVKGRKNNLVIRGVTVRFKDHDAERVDLPYVVTLTEDMTAEVTWKFELPDTQSTIITLEIKGE